MTRILISGGAGYIGGTLSYNLYDKNINYAVIDNLSTSSKSNLPPGTIFYKGNINNILLLKKILKLFRPTHIIHLAASLDVRESEIKKKKYYINNIVNSKIFLNFFLNNNVKNFIFASTAAVYSKNSEKRNAEMKNVLPSNYYGKTKLSIEKYLLKYVKISDLNIKILRFFNVVGADYKLRSGALSKKSNQLFNSLCKSIKDKSNFKIYGMNLRTKDGTCVRDFVDVVDLVKVITFFALTSKNIRHKIFNIGTNKGHSVLQVINSFKKVLRKNINYSFYKKRRGDPIYSVCDNSRLRKFYKTEKFSSINDSIYRHYNFYKKKF
jgi:UDP-glucose 4-epimerase